MTITSADLDRAKVASFDRGYAEGFKAARSGQPYGSTAADMTNNHPSYGAPSQSQRHAPQGGAVSWDEIAAEMNAKLPPNAISPGRRL
ncbi:hypothetical protein NS228_06290 [Methylobacterium indicum]|uniref:hypothetical protein n=1 Tax=Methylobacterium indicum TaxID=1775910 RepID=UPI000733D44F|nr:hypothetical protein [Methylobacterium indicum]KTS30846.1 hypothetical protein NS229_14540 [Methylobacterium indicum]KTS41566.1 hypothetical protein NS228_06290 [Methylobacterium indicum]KTS45181.1 hypothetical protein NS230_24280 [Methylobacterium indicum]